MLCKNLKEPAWSTLRTSLCRRTIGPEWVAGKWMNAVKHSTIDLEEW